MIELFLRMPQIHQVLERLPQLEVHMEVKGWWAGDTQETRKPVNTTSDGKACTLLLVAGRVILQEETVGEAQRRRTGVFVLHVFIESNYFRT